MPIPLNDDHRELAAVVRSFVEREAVLAQARACLDVEAPGLPPLWKHLADLGWLGLHVPEDEGGAGYGLVETGVVLEELGRAVAPGPFLPTTVASAVLAHAPEHVRRQWLPGLVDGSVPGAVGFGDLALGGDVAGVFLLARGDDMVVASAEQVTTRPRASVDPTRPVVEVLELADDVVVLPGGRKNALAIARALASAEASGVAHACTDMAVDYAKVREQFGRVIGSFMAVKHHCADMKMQAEQATATAWDALRAVEHDGDEAQVAAAVAATSAFRAAIFCAQKNIQIFGGIGFTWEHDAHLFMRRAGATAALLGPAEQAAEDLYELEAAGVSRPTAIELPAEADTYRAEVRAFLEGFGDLDPVEQRRRLVEQGYLQPHWPRPWGRGAGPVEQLAIDEEFTAAGVERPDMFIGGWVTLTFTQHGSEDQVARWTRPSLLGETEWCQLFSEPNAGSDAAAVQTRGTKVDGGWRVNGQKVWTSGAQHCTHGFATVRTDPEAPKHRGVSMMAIDLRDPGVTIRPLRSINGESNFNEVFIDDVFVADDDVVGPLNDGWSIARATLGNERVSIGSGRTTGRLLGPNVLLDAAAAHRGDAGVARAVGALLAEDQAMKLINLRGVIRAVAGSEPSPEGNVTKLLGSEHGQRVAELLLVLAGEDGAVADEEHPAATRWITSRSSTIAGGTSEIARNQIGERLLGLPREPGLR